MEIRKVGVVGAGVMGVGLGQSLAQTGHEAILVDVSDAVLQRAREEIRQGLRFRGLFEKGERREDSATVLGRITFTTDLAALADVDRERAREVGDQARPLSPPRRRLP